MKYADINGASLAYDISGEGEPLIFVHGFLANATGEYYAELKKILACSYRVHFLDMRAHGGSAAVTENVTLDRCARDIVAFADVFHLGKPYLVGHSMGGFLSIAAAMLHPDRFRALALLTPAGSKGQQNPEAVITEFMAARKSRESMDQMFGEMFVSPPGQEGLDICRESALRMPDAIAERWMREEWPNSDLTDGLASIGLPVLSLIGAKDVVVPPQRQYEDMMLMPKAKVVTFTEEGHMLPVEKPEICATEILRFFQDLP
tara:strand:- start:213 stop:995 length:783 start_codon:yes stop_codon:yes gene_type:complete